MTDAPRKILNSRAQLLDMGISEPRPRWSWYLKRLKGAFQEPKPVHHYRLVQDGNEIASVATTMEPDDNSPAMDTLSRRTVVTFPDEAWTVRTRLRPPRGPAASQRSRKRRWMREDRTVEVVRSPANGEPLASLADPSSWKLLGPIEVTTSHGESVVLRPQSVGRRLLSGEALSIKRTPGGGFVVTPKAEVPLEAVLLHWHVMIGDIWVPRPGGGETVRKA